MDKSIGASPQCCKWNDDDVMEDKSSEGVSYKLSLPRDKSIMMLSMYTKEYPISHRDKSQSDKKESTHDIVLYDVLSEFSC
jgi:hypothetical protein